MRKRGEPRIRLAVDTALALVARYLPEPWRIDAALLFANGRLCLWDEWATLPAADKKRIAEYLRLRPEALIRSQEPWRSFSSPTRAVSSQMGMMVRHASPHRSTRQVPDQVTLP